ncbi:MAG TPA: sulfatase, partial [Myxococcota bacterium]|nr:sulfatase [Myxococcota bacterium]
MVWLMALLAACTWSPTPEVKAPEVRQPAHKGARPPDVADPAKLAAPKPAHAAAATWPDVIVVTLDTTRADHLGTYGYFRDTSPTIDAFAKTGIVFERMIVPMATTLPTHTSLFTGVYPIEHGITANVQHGGKQLIPTESLIPLAMWLSDAGYQTAGFTTAAPLNPTTGIERGFQVFTAPHGELRPGRDAVDDALGWLATTATDAPILLWVHLYDPHNPYDPDETYRKQFLDDSPNGGALDQWIDARQITKLTHRPTGEAVRARPTINNYDAEIRTMDDQIARLLAALGARGRLDGSLVIMMGDHGEGLNQHGEPGHGLVWQEQLHAPLILKAPGAAPRRVPGTISAIDVLPTALGLVELPDEARIRSQMTGVDVLADGFTTRPVFSQSSGRQVTLGKAQAWTLTDDHSSCRWTEGGDVVTWDLDADPYELAPVIRAIEPHLPLGTSAQS